MNPNSLDSSIQSALSALYPPFEATAPIVLSQLFRTIEERYHGDALQCLLDFLIPSKHLLESVQQAACAGYSDVVFRCEGWPLCLHDKTVVQLAPVNPLLLRPGDFYFQVEPFGDQAARIVLKSLLEEGCREVEQTPIPETSYPCIFTEDWLREINEGRHGTPLSRCLLCTDQGVIKLPWAEVAVPEFLDKPKVLTTHQEAPAEPKLVSVPCTYSASTLPLEARFIPLKDRMSASLRPVDPSSKLFRSQHKQIPKSFPKPLVKPVGWVSPNTWDSRNYPESEGDYVDLVDVVKENQFMVNHGNQSHLPHSVLVKPVRPRPSELLGSSLFGGRTLQYVEEPCAPCSQRNLGTNTLEQEAKCRYRDSYLAALSHPVAFEKGSVDLLAALEEVGLCEDLDLRSEGAFEDQNNVLGQFCNHCKTPVSGQCRHCCEPTTEIVGSHHKNIPPSSEPGDTLKESPVIVESRPCLNYSHNIQTQRISQDKWHPESRLDNWDGQDVKSHQKVDVVKPPGKHKSKPRSLSTVSDTPQGSPLFYKVNNRSHSDICPETVSSMMRCNKEELLTPKMNSSKKDSQSHGIETPPTSDGPHVRLHNLKTQVTSSSQLPSVSSNATPQSLGSSFQSVSGLLELGVICLPGSRDKTGRAVVELHCDKEPTSPPLSAQNICQLLLYLHSIPRKDVRELGLTLVIDARKKAPPPHLYTALLMAQEQALHAVHCMVVLLDKDTSPRPDKQPGLQMDLVTSMKGLYKTVDASQLTPDLGGTFAYSHTAWLQFHQRLISFMVDLREADGLLQSAIANVNNLNAAQEVRRCVQEQRDLMREVLKDAGLVALQREGGAVLARMRREAFRFPQSRDYRDALESVTLLYNQVEEKLHMLVMKSNESLQQLEVLLVVKEMEEKMKEAAMWFSEEGEHGLKVFAFKDNVYAENVMQQFDTFHSLAKEKQHIALTLVTEAEQIVSTGVSGPATDVLRTCINTFKCHVDDFMSRLGELDTLVQVYRFCDQASALAKECGELLEQVEQGCYPAQAGLSTLQMYGEILGHEFSTLRFQAFKSKACSIRPGAAGAMSAWNAAWVLCQEVRQRLEKMQKKKKACRDKKQNQQTTARGEAEGPGTKTLTRQPTSQKDVVDITESEHAAWFKNHSRASLKGNENKETHALRNVETHIRNYKCQLDTKWRRRGHRSEIDLRSTVSVQGDADIPMGRSFGRSLSEGSCVSTPMQFVTGFPPSNVRLCQSDEPALKHHLETTPLTQTTSESPGTGEERPAKDHAAYTQSPEDLKGTLLISTESNNSDVLKLRKIMQELLSTEREYVKALGYVRQHYFPELERGDVPQDLRGQKGSVFGNLEKLHDFHLHFFLEELEKSVQEPFRVGRCFLRHREHFALYALYSKNKPQSDRLLINHGKAFFKQKQQNLGDKMDLWSYLLKPVQRISKYSLLLQDMMRECGPAQVRELDELKAALEVVHFQLRHGNNLLAMDAIHQCDVNLKEQGQLIRQDQFSVTFRKKKCSRRVFLFQELILFSKTRKTDVGNDTYVYKQSFKTSDVGMTQNTGVTGLCFEIWFRKRKTQDTYTLQAASREAKEAWTKDLERILWDQALHNREVRMQERVFLGIGSKPFKDIQPSDAAISDRAVHCGLIGRENKVLSYAGPYGPHNGLPGARPKSAGSGSTSSSSSSGRGSLSPTAYLCVPKRRVQSNSFEGYISPPGVLEEDNVDHESGSHNLMLDSSESSGESVSGLSSSAHSFRSVLEREAEEVSPVCAPGIAHWTEPGGPPEKNQTVVAVQDEPQNKAKDLPCDKNPNVGKSTEV
ncbi:uncharacterized protein LOC133655818 isoform X1 [Entelurus aequoreus]|uniref:uncharacterized protein LOC133655818 isoform X1 n=1 Tax=Entelurus aequoreus TaxID=161455 RepID=UPI002B1D4D68|nr:uncharacterized protein LOC133655818 isoform X1 [Entelurus aequoreus]